MGRDGTLVTARRSPEPVAPSASVPPSSSTLPRGDVSRRPERISAISGFLRSGVLALEIDERWGPEELRLELWGVRAEIGGLAFDVAHAREEERAERDRTPDDGSPD